MDYRQLNAKTIPDRYPLPRIDDLLHEATTAPYMSTIDLRSGYWQIAIDKQHKEKTGFITPFGIFVFKRMPFGLRNAPATFQRLMDRFKIELKNILVLAYLDDLIIRSFTFKQHLDDLATVFKRLQVFSLKVNREKCKFFSPKNQISWPLYNPAGTRDRPR